MSKLPAPPAKYSRGFMVQLDQRTETAKELNERFNAYANDLGGIERLSYAQRSLLEHCLFLQYWLSQQEQALVNGTAEFDSGKYAQALNTFSGLIAKLGLKRVAKEISLKDIMSNAK